MELRQFVKHFYFRDSDRSLLTLGTDTRVNPLTNRAQLQEDSNNEYPTSDDLYVKSRLTNPLAVREWQGFEAFIAHKKIYGETKTSAGFRLSDGTDEFYWNGSAWEVNTSDWNTEAEVSANISSFSVASRKLQVVVNLKTTDKTVTPELVEIRVLYGGVLDDEIEDIIVRTLLPALRGLRPITRFVETMVVLSDTVDLWDSEGNTKFEGAYKIVDVDSAYNDTDDPDHLTDIYQSHTSKPSGEVDVVSLTTGVAAGKDVFLRLKYEPVVAVETSRDFYEIDMLPQLVIEDIAFVDATEFPLDDHVGDRDTGTARVLPGPLQGDLLCSMVGMADKLVDVQRLGAAVSRYFGQTPLLTSTGLDESYRLWQVEDYDYRGSPNAQDVHTWRKVFRIQHFCVWNRPARDGNLVKRFKTTGNVIFTVE